MDGRWQLSGMSITLVSIQQDPVDGGGPSCKDIRIMSGCDKVKVLVVRVTELEGV